MHYSGYAEEELKPTAQLMLDFVVRNSALAQPDKRADNPLHPSQTPVEDPLPNFVKVRPAHSRVPSSDLSR